MKRAFNTGCIQKNADFPLDNTAAPTDDSSMNENLVSLVSSVVQDGVSDADDISAVRQQLMSKCAQVIGVAGVCESREALLCALDHINTAHASLRTLTRVPPASLTVTRKIHSNKKIDKQLRFFPTKMKRRAVGRTLKKPASLQVSAAKRNMLNSKLCDKDVPQVDSAEDVETSLATAVILPSSSESPSETVPYCVGTETVCTATTAGSGTTDTTLPNGTMVLHLDSLGPSQQQGIDHDVEVLM